MQLTDLECAAVRFLAERYQQSHDDVCIADIPGVATLPPVDQPTFIDRLCHRELVNWASDGSVSVLPLTVNVAYQLDHPPVVNQWTQLLQWWFAARWRAALTALLVILPLLVQWIQMIQTVLSWCGVASG